MVKMDWAGVTIRIRCLSFTKTCSGLRSSAALGLLIISVFSFNVSAESDFSFSGFGTIGTVYNDNDYLNFHRDFTMRASDDRLSFKVDSLLGLQANYNLSAKFDAMAQVVIKDPVTHDNLDSLEWLFLRYRPSRDWAIRVGRLSVDLYMLSEYRDVSYAYLWSRPIPEFYSPISSVSKIDGMDVTYSTMFSDTLFEAKLAIGGNSSTLQGALETVELKFADALAFTSSIRTGDWHFRLAVALAEIDSFKSQSTLVVDGLMAVPASLWPEASDLADGFTAEGQKLQYYAFGLEYDYNNWLIQSEVGFTDSKWLLLDPYYSGYISVGYRIEDFTLFGVFAHIDLTDSKKPVPGPDLPEFLPSFVTGPIEGLYGGVNASLSLTQMSQSTYTLGARWDFYPNTALKFQWDHSVVDKQGAALWVGILPEPLDGAQDINLFSLNLSFIFNL